ncbi:MAG: hypothetical protein WGN25_03695 [Candidatus Electrothrix sp. GW3-4]|uniref:hypothetical protein n=1 Tax=Candidatus Electrothrix sp. GW3-4 TaxID=3126740 RepID=UPI0030D0278A
MEKKIWLSAIGANKETVQAVMAKLQGYGLAVDGHFFTDDLEKMAWAAPRQQLLASDVALWLILGSAADLAQPTVRYGLSMLALTVQAERGPGFPPMIILQGEGEVVLPESLPSPLADARILSLANDAYAAKLVAAAHTATVQVSQPSYRLDVYGISQIGQWFEVGPRDDAWQGAIFGVSSGEISLHAVGPAGQLPERSVLNYPQQGLEVKLGDCCFTAWAVQNPLDLSSSYYLKVEGSPERIMFCPYSSEQETEAYIISLQ